VVFDGASFDLNDRGLQYGDGFFTTMLVLDNNEKRGLTPMPVS
jgi:branched-subunit amino acid aminotransferase/4-amino-4-deoxychorismate lyase